MLQKREMENFIRELPKAELHLHIEGSLEPELMFDLAVRNKVEILYKTVDEIRSAYKFDNLQSFLDIYYAGASVLLQEEDFADLAYAYMKRIAADGCSHTEIFFDPQTHTARNVSFETALNGIEAGMKRGEKEFGITFKIIMSFLRHLSEADAFILLEQAKPFLNRIDGVGLDSSEVGNPPEKFERVFQACKELGLPRVAHAGEEGPASYIWDAITKLDVCRIDHGVASRFDEKLMSLLRESQMALTCCPLSNYCLKVFKTIEEMQEATLSLLRAGLCVTLNADDPAYFGGYLLANYMSLCGGDVSKAELTLLAKNSIQGSWLPAERKAELCATADEILLKYQ